MSILSFCLALLCSVLLGFWGRRPAGLLKELSHSKKKEKKGRERENR
jgi:hypothetical protein